MQNILGISTFCPWLEVKILHARTHDLGLTAMFLIQVRNTSTKVEKCTGFRTRTHFFGGKRYLSKHYKPATNVIGHLYYTAGDLEVDKGYNVVRDSTALKLPFLRGNTCFVDPYHTY